MTEQEILDLGFERHEDGSGDERGVRWLFENDNFRIEVDAWHDVHLIRKFPDGDEGDGLFIEQINNVSELQVIKDWIN
jgi:hypothetical protein